MLKSRASLLPNSPSVYNWSPRRQLYNQSVTSQHLLKCNNYNLCTVQTLRIISVSWQQLKSDNLSEVTIISDLCTPSKSLLLCSLLQQTTKQWALHLYQPFQKNAAVINRRRYWGFYYAEVVFHCYAMCDCCGLICRGNRQEESVYYTSEIESNEIL